MKSQNAREYIEACITPEPIESIAYISTSTARAAVEIAEAEIIDRAVGAFNRSCALMQDCQHCPGDCFCEDNFRALIADPEAKLWKCDI